MAQYLNYGAEATRPGNYFNYDKKGKDKAAGATDGVSAVLFKSNWGPLGEAVVRSADEGYESIFGNSGTTDAIALCIEGGTSELILVRVGSGGTAATLTLKNAEASAKDAVKLTAKYVGSRAFSISIRDSISDNTKRECIIYDGTTEFEKRTFAKGEGEVDAMVAAFAGSKNFDVVKASTSVTGALATVTQVAFTAGTDPTAQTTDYSNALTVAEQYEQNCIVVDTNEYAVIALVTAYCQRMFNAGKNVIGVVGEAKSVALDTRMQHAAACNAANMVYVLNGNVEHGVYGSIDGYQTAAKVGGMIASGSCKYSLTHTVLSSVTALNEILTEANINAGEESGCLVLTLNSKRQVWIDSAINTLITPASNQDSGWKKIRRTKTRFELLTRCNNTVDEIVGKVDNDTAGRITIKDTILTVGIAMIGEGKIQYCDVQEDAAHTADGDSCWFLIDVIDKDSAEHIYLRYLFRFSTQLITEAA